MVVVSLLSALLLSLAASAQPRRPTACHAAGTCTHPPAGDHAATIRAEPEGVASADGANTCSKTRVLHLRLSQHSVARGAVHDRPEAPLCQDWHPPGQDWNYTGDGGGGRRRYFCASIGIAILGDRVDLQRDRRDE
jgi:hypothetical protein